jgi:mono/diheme cytochrome c family protein
MLAKAALGFSILGLAAILLVTGCVDYGDKPAVLENATATPSNGLLVNPEPGDLTSATRGGMAFSQNCARCHGSGAKGDGPEGVNLPSRPRDLTAPRMHDLADGEIFQTISAGRGYMPSWKSRLSELQIWDLVNYIRTLSPEGG